MADKTCDDGGMLVGAKENLPTDIHERYRRDGDIVGCNRILCGLCGAWVRNVAGVKIDVESFTRRQHETFYDELGGPRREWPFLTTNVSGDQFRVYACRCNWDQTPRIRWLNSSECDGWQCAGHPET